ncbi:MAG: GNAT family N-acetyltransferase [Actinobacteria bacterium]|nr:GNAT family N-acetyltransferase [Actinomycetota bacterium]
MGGRLAGDTLAAFLRDVAAGRFPPADGDVTIIPPPAPRDAGVIGFSGHALIFADTEPAWVKAQLPAGDLAAPLSPAFLQALCERTGRRAHAIDMLCAGSPLPGPPPITLTRELDLDHPRAQRALRYRDDVRAWRAGGGVVVLGRGIASRWEVAVEVDPGERCAGLGRALAAAARHLVPDGTPVWAQIAPANAASVRAFLAAGFKPVGAECLLTPARPLGAPPT